MFYFHPYLGKLSNLTSIFFKVGWFNHSKPFVSGFRHEPTVGFQQKGVELPSELCVWSDNTVKENKNPCVLCWMQWLVATQKFKICSLITGHTHNALDQLYGLLATAFRYVDDLFDPDDVVQQISTQLALGSHSTINSIR